MRKKVLSIIGLVLLILIILFIIFRNINFGYRKIYSMYDFINQKGRTTEIGIPKLSFDYNEENSIITVKSLSSYRVDKDTVNDILSTYKEITCHNKKYYYDDTNDFTIIDYGIKKHYFFNTIYFEYRFGNYCDTLK